MAIIFYKQYLLFAKRLLVGPSSAMEGPGRGDSGRDPVPNGLLGDG